MCSYRKGGGVVRMQLAGRTSWLQTAVIRSISRQIREAVSSKHSELDSRKQAVICVEIEENGTNGSVES